MKRKSENRNSSADEIISKIESKKCKTSVDGIKNIKNVKKTSKKSVKIDKSLILTEGIARKAAEKSKKDEAFDTNETKIHKKKVKCTTKKEDCGDGKKSLEKIKKVKKSISFRENVEVMLGDSNDKEEKQLKEDLTDTTHISNMISEINSLKKGKSKKQKKLEKNNADSKLVQQQCIDYLRKWKNDKKNWKFEKAKQIRLLSYMFDSMKLPDEVFPMFLEYINGSKGNITKVIAQKCSVVVKEMEDFLEIGEEEKDKTKPNEKQYERARSILQAVEDCNL